MKTDFQVTIVIDTREQRPLAFKRFPAVTGALDTGDYSALGLEHLFAVERKSLDDLAGCCGHDRDRFERELHRLRGYRFKRLLVVGTVDQIERHDYRSRITPAAVLGSIRAFEARYDVPVVFCPDPEAAAVLVEDWAFWYAREQVEVVEALQKLPF